MNTTDATSGAQCPGFEGAADFYGIGIRVGVYLSWYATLAAHAFVETYIDGLADANTLFLVANLVALTFASARRSLAAVEAFLVLSIFLGYFLSAWSVAGIRLGTVRISQARWSPRRRAREDGEGDSTTATATTTTTKKGRFELFHGRVAGGWRGWTFVLFDGYSTLGTGFRLSLGLTAAAYAVWFFFVGLDVLPSEQCEPVVFLLGRHGLFGPVRTFFKVFSVVLCVMLGGFYLLFFAYMFILEVGMLLIGALAVIVTALLCPGCFRKHTLSERLRTIARYIIFSVNTSRATTGWTGDLEGLDSVRAEHVETCFGHSGGLSRYKK